MNARLIVPFMLAFIVVDIMALSFFDFSETFHETFPVFTESLQQLFKVFQEN